MGSMMRASTMLISANGAVNNPGGAIPARSFSNARFVGAGLTPALARSISVKRSREGINPSPTSIQRGSQS